MRRSIVFNISGFILIFSLFSITINTEANIRIIGTKLSGTGIQAFSSDSGQLYKFTAKQDSEWVSLIAHIGILPELNIKDSLVVFQTKLSGTEVREFIPTPLSYITKFTSYEPDDSGWIDLVAYTENTSGVILRTKINGISTVHNTGATEGINKLVTSIEDDWYCLNIETASVWEIRIIASSDATQDSFAYAGVVHGASSWYDPEYDVPKPPNSPSPYIQTFFPHPEWNNPLTDNFAKDMRMPGEIDTTMIFNFTERTDQTDITLQFVPNQVPANYGIYLMDMQTGIFEDLKAFPTYHYTQFAESIHEFKLLVGKPQRNVFAGWTLISVPLLPKNPTTATIFGDWGFIYYLYGFTSSAGYTSPDSIEIGSGYWLGVSNNCVLGNIEGDNLNPDTTCFVSTEKGWNIIGDPFPFSVKPDSVRKGDTTLSMQDATNIGWVYNILYNYAPKTNEYISIDHLSPWTGCWFPAIVPGCELLIQKDIAVKSSPTVCFDSVSVDSWNLTIHLVCPEARDRITYLGVAPDATDESDMRYDYPEPPNPPGNWVQSYFPHPEWEICLGEKFNADIRAPFEENQSKTWKINIESSFQEKELTVSWPSISKVPKYFAITLTDLDAKTDINMRLVENYIYTHTIKRHFEIKVTRRTGINEQDNKYAFALSQKPNPFMKKTIITYSVPRTVKVKLTLYDLSGRVVRTFVDRESKPGYYTISFDSKELTSGVYFLKFKADKFKAVQKLILMK